MCSTDNNDAVTTAMNLAALFHGGVLVEGTIWVGQNLADVLGGVGQNGAKDDEISALSGWLQIGVKIRFTLEISSGIRHR